MVVVVVVVIVVVVVVIVVVAELEVQGSITCAQGTAHPATHGVSVP